MAQLKQIMDKQEACLSWRGEVPAFSAAVKDSLNNPASLKHVSTKFIVPTADGNNAVMTFIPRNCPRSGLAGT